ncbi:hypothetical protein TNCV_1800081 [Trichonephila clavipes]|nr:hypothetical protein TNCV_1800081 [Trichonephila clavipes]
MPAGGRGWTDETKMLMLLGIQLVGTETEFRWEEVSRTVLELAIISFRVLFGNVFDFRSSQKELFGVYRSKTEQKGD